MDKQTAIDLLDNLLGMVEDNHESDYDTAIKMGIDALKTQDMSGNMSGTHKSFDDAQNAAMHESCTDCPLYDHDRHSCPRFNTVIPRTIEEVKPRWISVEEALPDRGKTVLITNDKGNVRCGRFRGVEFWKDDGDAYWTFKGNTVEHVLAWMPLPEPWRGGQDENDRR